MACTEAAAGEEKQKPWVYVVTSLKETTGEWCGPKLYGIYSTLKKAMTGGEECFCEEDFHESQFAYWDERMSGMQMLSFRKECASECRFLQEIVGFPATGSYNGSCTVAINKVRLDQIVHRRVPLLKAAENLIASDVDMAAVENEGNALAKQTLFVGMNHTTGGTEDDSDHDVTLLGVFSSKMKAIEAGRTQTMDQSYDVEVEDTSSEVATEGRLFLGKHKEEEESRFDVIMSSCAVDAKVDAKIEEDSFLWELWFEPSIDYVPGDEDFQNGVKTYQTLEHPLGLEQSRLSMMTNMWKSSKTEEEKSFFSGAFDSYAQRVTRAIAEKKLRQSNDESGAAEAVASTSSEVGHIQEFEYLSDIE